MVRETKRQRGSGITERTITHRAAKTQAEAEAALEELDAVLADPLAKLRGRIATAGLAYQDWRAENAGTDRGDETVPDLLLQVTLAGEDMERALAGGNAERAAAFAAGAAELLALLWFKHNWQADALRGKKAPEDASRGGKERARIIRQERHPQIRADYAERLARLGDESAAKAATARAARITPRQLRRILTGK